MSKQACCEKTGKQNEMRRNVEHAFWRPEPNYEPPQSPTVPQNENKGQKQAKAQGQALEPQLQQGPTQGPMPATPTKTNVEVRNPRSPKLRKDPSSDG